jgi:hypothetical protein
MKECCRLKDSENYFTLQQKSENCVNKNTHHIHPSNTILEAYYFVRSTKLRSRRVQANRNRLICTKLHVRVQDKAITNISTFSVRYLVQ